MNAWVSSTSDRFWARAIDEALVGALSAPVAIPLLMDFFANGYWAMPWMALGFFILLHVAYEWTSYAFFQATPGKWVMGLRLVDADDPMKELTDAQIFLRILSMRFQFFFSWAPFALAFYRYDRTHLADWLAGTRVASDHRRARHAKLRWISGGVFVIVFFFAGLESSGRLLASLEWDQNWVSWSSDSLENR